MDKLEKYLKAHASKKPLIINESTLLNEELEKDFEKLEAQLKKLAKEGKIKYEHQIFPPESSQEQIVVHWIK